jgi:hypothetical protein
MKGLQLLAIFTVALLLGTTLTNVLEMPPPLGVPGGESMWQTPVASRVAVAGPLEIVAVVINLALLTAALSRPHLLFLSAGAALCLVGAFSVWVVFTEPVDVMAQRWLAGGLPTDGSAWRSQWEFSQLVRFLLHLAALLLLAASHFLLPAEEYPERDVAHG